MNGSSPRRAFLFPLGISHREALKVLSSCLVENRGPARFRLQDVHSLEDIVINGLRTSDDIIDRLKLNWHT